MQSSLECHPKRLLNKIRKGILRLIAHIYAASPQRKEEKIRQTYATSVWYIYASINGYVFKLMEAYALLLPYHIALDE